MQRAIRSVSIERGRDRATSRSLPSAAADRSRRRARRSARHRPHPDPAAPGTLQRHRAPHRGRPAALHTLAPARAGQRPTSARRKSSARWSACGARPRRRGFATADVKLERFADLRYRKQISELMLPCPSARSSRPIASGSPRPSPRTRSHLRLRHARRADRDRLAQAPGARRAGVRAAGVGPRIGPDGGVATAGEERLAHSAASAARSRRASSGAKRSATGRWQGRSSSRNTIPRPSCPQAGPPAAARGFVHLEERHEARRDRRPGHRPGHVRSAAAGPRRDRRRNGLHHRAQRALDDDQGLHGLFGVALHGAGRADRAGGEHRS